MLDFHQMFGGPASLGNITVNLNDDNSVNNVSSQYNYYLYNSVKLYLQMVVESATLFLLGFMEMKLMLMPSTQV